MEGRRRSRRGTKNWSEDEIKTEKKKISTKEKIKKIGTK